jgi:hypothetical protein
MDFRRIIHKHQRAARVLADLVEGDDDLGTRGIEGEGSPAIVPTLAPGALSAAALMLGK